MTDRLTVDRELLERVLKGMVHLSSIARTWEPDHSSGSDRQQWVHANEAAKELRAALAQPEQEPIPTTWHKVGYYHKASTPEECDFYFLDAINGDCPDCHPCYADTAAFERPASPQSAPEPTWRPIESAPKDETLFIAIGDNFGEPEKGTHATLAKSWSGGFVDDEGALLQYLTHWAPLPPAPGTEPVKESLTPEPLTDEQCDAIYSSLDWFGREADPYDYGLPECGDYPKEGRAVIRRAIEAARAIRALAKEKQS